MAEIKYTANRDIPENIAGVERYSTEDTQLISSFEVNSSFDTRRHIVELHLLTLSDEILFSEYDYRGYKQLGNAQSSGQEGASVLTIDPIQDSISFDYGNGGVKLLYHFLNDLFTDDTSAAELYIQDISPDRTELKLTSLTISPTDLERFTNVIKSKLDNEAFFNEFRLNFGDNDLLIGINIDTLDNGIEKEVTVKLYEPLPFTYGIKSKLRIVELVADSSAYEVQTDITPEPVLLPTLKPANFNIEVQDENVIPTQYLNYDELFSYPVNNANSQLFSLVNEKGVDISIDHTSYSDFIHFSSAQERLINFKYKLDLVTSYSASLSAIDSQTPGTQGVLGLQGISGSRTYFEGLMEGVLNNFDHYERFLYYESGSSSWPKTNTSKPYQNQVSTTQQSILWYSNQIAEAISYDNTNYSSLIYSIPSYLREDPNNENYLTFIHMIGHHFDNLWLYADAVTDKYDADNRMNKGISKDLVGEALKNFGVKLYTSNKSIEDLFSSFIGQAYVSGSETIRTYITGSLIGSNTPIEPSSFDNYQKEIQKRIYHNLSYLLKTKGTERGLRALINCFGIPSDILNIKLYGGRNTNERSFYGDYEYYTSSLDKIRTDHTGSTIPGNTLSSYTSTVKRDNKYTDDLHAIEVGFSPTDNVDKYITSKQTCITYLITNGPVTSGFTYKTCQGTTTGPLILGPNGVTSINAQEGSVTILPYQGAGGIIVSLTPTAVFSSFNIDDYIGNPSSLTLPNYEGLYKVAEGVLGDLDQYDVRAYIRLIKFFDNVIFKMVKDFIPARTVADTGIIIKPNLLNRSKAKSVKASVDTILSASMDNAFNYTSSINTAFTEGYHGNTFGAVVEYTASYKQVVETPIGRTVSLNRSKGEAKFDGELANSFIRVTTGELNNSNVLKKGIPPRVQFNVKFYENVPVGLCTLAGQAGNDVFTVRPGIPYALGPLFGGNGVSAPANTVYRLNSNTGQVIPSTYTFTTGQYQDTVIYGRSNETCFETVTFRTVACTLGPITAPNYIIAGANYDFVNWFPLGVNNQVTYTVQKNNETPIPLPPGTSTYTFIGGITGDRYTVTVADKFDPTCKTSVSRAFYSCFLSPQEDTQVDLYAGPLANQVLNIDLTTFFEGELPNATYYVYPGLSKPSNWAAITVPAIQQLTTAQAQNFTFGSRGVWVKLVNVPDNCERVIRLYKSGDATMIVQLGLAYGAGGPNQACINGALNVSSGEVGLLGQVYYTKLVSQAPYDFPGLWTAGKLLKTIGTDEPISGWYSDGTYAYFYTNGYPNTQVQNASSANTGVILCNSLHGPDQSYTLI